MKKIISFFMILSFPFLAKAQGTCGVGCSWEKNGTKLIITADDNAVMDDFNEEWNSTRKVYETTAPWGADITEVEIVGGLTNISRSAFEGAQFTSIKIPDTVTSIGEDAFSWNRNLSNLTIPENVTSVAKWAFAKDSSLTEVIFPASVSSIGPTIFSDNINRTVVVENPSADISDTAFNTSTHVYCKSLAQCQGKGANDENITLFSITDEGIYQVGSGDDAKYYVSADFMGAGEEKSCQSLEQCQKIINATSQNGMYMIGNKMYNSVDDMLSGNYIKKRIYTVEEANLVAGKTNRVTIRYR